MTIIATALILVQTTCVLRLFNSGRLY